GTGAGTKDGDIGKLAGGFPALSGFQQDFPAGCAEGAGGNIESTGIDGPGDLVQGQTERTKLVLFDLHMDFRTAGPADLHDGDVRMSQQAILQVAGEINEAAFAEISINGDAEHAAAAAITE